MEKSEKIDRLKGLLSPVIGNHGAFLVDLSLKGDARRELLEVFCETEKGITIDQCAEISGEILPLIDSSRVLGETFRLEVSSPGVGAPLKDKRQYRANIGRLMVVKYRDGTDVKQTEGDLAELTDDKIILKTEMASVEIGFDSILESRVKIRW
jgi:ribosome maturation factor RimP